ncbi:MAG: hypothetical protein ACD_49C00029G0006 [uncultured bacterium (gcode 4)]|uniref:Phosphoribosyltransferase domain-containing protein n=1 Tax=uncultured bacterium (gcode 4) TaxID=1234023 RepID=K2BCT6_9BACT|nr:MAG: hypothetical protein ACD_49C00029G0006 [uncultured bacterium (gcode 4)]
MSNPNKVDWSGTNTPKKLKWWPKDITTKNQQLISRTTHKLNEILAEFWFIPVKEFIDKLVASEYSIENMLTKTDKMSEFEKILYTWSRAELIKHLGAIYRKPEWRGKYARLTGKLISSGYVNFWVTERDFRVLERAADELARKINESEVKFAEHLGENMKQAADNLKPNVIMWAQMWSVRISSFLGKALNIYESIYAEKDWKELKLKRHDIDLKWKNVILSEDVITKGSTLAKMIKLVNDAGWKVVYITCVINRSGKDNYAWIHIKSCYIPEKFWMYYDNISVRKIFEETLEDNWFNEFFIQESMSVFPENIFWYRIDNISTKRNLLLIFEKIRNEFYRNELIKITNKVFDKFEKDWVLPFPKKGEIEESPKANWGELVSVM